MRQIFETEVFPNADPPSGQPMALSVFNLAYYPNEKGPYNYDVEATAVSSGIYEDGLLKNPASRWGGVMRKIESSDFEASNIELVEFWIMDPYVYSPNHPGGDFYFDLGNISEDILKDSRKSFENGLPVDYTNPINIDTTAWGRVPVQQSLVNAFVTSIGF